MRWETIIKQIQVEIFFLIILRLLLSYLLNTNCDVNNKTKSKAGGLN